MVRKGYVWEVSWRLNKDCNILTPNLLAIAVFLSRSSWLLNRGPGGLASAVTWFSLLELQHLIPNSVSKLWSPTDSTSQSHRVISLFYVHLLPVASQFALNSTRRHSRLSHNIFDRMHLLFMQVNLPFDSSAGSEVSLLHVHVVHPYSRTDIVSAWNKSRFRPLNSS